MAAKKKTGYKTSDLLDMGFYPTSPTRANKAKDTYKDEKFTVLDLVKQADSINKWDLPGSYEKGMEIRDTIDEALVEKDPTRPRAGGTYKGSVYFSNILPEGQGDIPWTKEAAAIVKKASQYGAKKSDILAAQNYFAKIGYMHPSEVDGMPGKQFRGMVSRWNKNPGVSKEAMFDAMETWKDNIFGGDEE